MSAAPQQPGNREVAAANPGSSSSSSREQESTKLSAGRSALLLDRLRSKVTSTITPLRNLAELSKATRTTLLDRRFNLDSVEKGILQQCLDTLQERIPVSSAAGMAERLETIGRKTGLKFMAAPVHGCYYLSTEMFYVEINIDSAGNVNEAKIHHIDTTQSNQPPITQNCPEIIDCLSNGDFAKFIAHLNGLVSIYNLSPATAPEKSKAWNALSCLEQDLEMIFAGYSSYATGDAIQFLHQTPLGLVQPRTGGLPMRLRYFLPPFELVDEKTNSLLPCTLGSITARDLGYSVTVIMEKSDAPCRLQVTSLMAMDANGVASMANEMNQANSIALPARFVLQLKSPMALSVEQCLDIQRLTGFEFFNANDTQPLMQLIARNKSKNQLDTANQRGLFVTLPGQHHCYFLSDPPDFLGVNVTSIPFSHPSNVAEILAILRQQALFNTLVESCVRVNALQDLDKSIMFEVSFTDLQHLTVTFEHPVEECIANVELDLTDIGDVKANIYSTLNVPVCSEELVNKIMKKCLSIPVTMRSIILAGQGQARSAPPAESASDASDVPVVPLSNYASNNGNHVMGDSRLNGSNGSKLIGSHHSNGGFRLPRDDIDDRGGGSGGGQSHDKMTPGAAAAGGGTKVKSEPMDFETQQQQGTRNFQPSSSDSLNEFGPQDATFNSEASSKTKASSSSSSAAAAAGSGSGRTSSGSSSLTKIKVEHSEVVIKPETNLVSPQVAAKVGPVEPELMLTKSSKPPPPTSGGTSSGSSLHHDKIKAEKKDSGSSGGMSSSSSFGSDIKPSVSITPIIPTSSSATATSSGSSSKKAVGGNGGGIEIIPLGGGGADAAAGGSAGSSGANASSSSGSSSSSKNRDIRRSLSEDDKRRAEKKIKKRKHDSSGREISSSNSSSSSSAKKKLLGSPDIKPKSSSPSSSSLSISKSSSGGNFSSKSKLSSVIDRLAGDSSNDIEIVPTQAPVGPLSSSSQSKSKSSSGSSSSSSSKTSSSSSSTSLKLNVKLPTKPSSSSGGSSSNSSNLKESSSSKPKSSSSSPSSKDKSGSSSSNRHSSSSKTSSSSAHSKHSSSSSSGSFFSSSQSKSKSSSSSGSSSSSDKDRKRDHGSSSSSSGSSSNSRPKDYHSSDRHHSYHSSSSSSYKDRDREEEVKNILGGGKLNKTFQIPKLSSKSSSPSTSRLTPTTSPKYASVSPKQAALGGLPLGAGGASPKYIGGGSVTPPPMPNVSPKHPYSAPSSVPGLTRSSPLHTSPKAQLSRTPSASPTYGANPAAKFRLKEAGEAAEVVELDDK